MTENVKLSLSLTLLLGIAAGIVLVREAGGRVTDVVGGDGMLGSGDIVAAGPEIHARMLQITGSAFRDS